MSILSTTFISAEKYIGWLILADCSVVATSHAKLGRNGGLGPGMSTIDF